MSFFFDGISIQNLRKSNMDSLLLKERNIKGTDVCIAVVCDGIGSLEDGAFASSTAVRMLNQWFSGISGLGRLGLQMRDSVLEINAHIVKQAQDQGLRTGTTLSALLLTEEEYYVVHTGDSRIYICQDGLLRPLTEDQSLDGRLTACLGRGEKTDLYYNEGGFRSGRFLLCSDGLYKRMEHETLQAELEHVSPKTMGKTIERLIRHVTCRGERDNISLAVVLKGK